MLRRGFAALLILPALALGIAACSGGGPSPAGGGSPGTVVIRNFTFEPADLTVAPGATVTVRNEDNSTHTVTADGGAFDTGYVAPGHTATFKAPPAGRYLYHCAIHQFMRGSLTAKG